MLPRNQLHQSIWRGAKIGAASLGLVGFVAGISVCVAYHLPFPPIAVTEIGVILGGSLGAMAGYAWCFPGGRGTLKGCAVGSLAGLPVAGLLHGQVSIPAWLACALIASLLGYQSACMPGQADQPDWKLR
ncbi:hypothetical protein JST97_04220 [bacterium]|nr:hypothetical protein [bacterium]